MTFIENYNLAEDADFQMKVKAAGTKAASDTLASQTADKWLINYSQLIINNPTGQGWVSAMSHIVTSNVAINEQSTDADIEYTVNSNFVKLAKAYYFITE